MNKSERVDEFVTLFTQHSRRMYALIRALVYQQVDAEDVFQDASRVLWEKFDDYQSGTDFLAWASRVSRLEVLMYRRRQARGRIVLSDAVYDLLEQEATAATGDFDGRHWALADCLEKLPPRDREILDARYCPGATTSSVAQSVNRSIDSIYRALRRIHHTLLECVRRKQAEEGE